jgi:hypothetical protein
MITERVRRLAILVLIAVHIAAPLGAAQPQRPDDSAPTGMISGDARPEAKKPYENFAVWIVDLNAAAIAKKTALDAKGMFRLDGLTVPGQYLVELVDIRKPEVVCTEGPFRLTLAAAEVRDAKIDCGNGPVGLWLLGVAAAVGVTAAVTTGPAVSAVR